MRLEPRPARTAPAVHSPDPTLARPRLRADEDGAPHVQRAEFRRARDNCGITDLHFHDSRREALTRLSKKVPVETLAKISGHRSLNILLNVYYRPDMAEIADMLD